MSTLKVNEIQNTSGVVRRGIQTYAIICDQKTQNTNGGTFTSGAWRTRDLNTEIADPDGIVSISSNQFTLGTGAYLIEAEVPAYRVQYSQTRLYNATASSVIQPGRSMYTDPNGNVNTVSLVTARVVITGNTAFEIQHRSAATLATFGFGVASNFTDEVYTIVKIFKEA
ncbi:hypothetical protein [uncultured phage MedDCM-OCT-S09-C399]|nr:hypothetical protein [uncultured phage MedDCM-OCT-S09-C399]|tara:strand:- start:1118 stop:1624 length:507 start_codon:yes stop_codon:yes gene_type:complete